MVTLLGDDCVTLSPKPVRRIALGDFNDWRSADDVFPGIRNIFCVGRNYREHANELNNAVPTEPMIFAKPTHSLSAATGVVTLPADRTSIHYELEIVLYIAQPVTASSTARDVVGAVALGLDLTDRDAQDKLKAKGHPWELAKGFVGSAVVSDFYQFDDFSQVRDATFQFELNGAIVQTGHPTDMVFDFDTLIQHVHHHFGLTQGDILFTGTPAGVGPLRDGDTGRFYMNGQTWADFKVRHNVAGKGD